jgi:hypothetical protein
LVSGVDLIEGGDAVQKPDVVTIAIVLDEGEVRVRRRWIEFDLRFGIPRR